MWVGQWLFFFNRSCFSWSSVCEGSDLKGFLPRQSMVSSDSHVLWCTLSEFVLDRRRWLWLCRNSGKHPKIHHSAVFFLLLALLCWRSCKVLISPCSCVAVSAAWRRWGVRASHLSAGTESCFTPPNHTRASHSCSLFLLGFVLVNSPLPPPKLTRVLVELQVENCLRACGDGAILPVRELIVCSWEMLLKVALSMKWKSRPRSPVGFVTFFFKK